MSDKKLNYFFLKSLNDLIELKESQSSYNNIKIDLNLLKNKGLIRHCIKYALWHIEIGGELHIVSSPFKSFKYSKTQIDFWQISREVFKSIGQDVECIKHDQKNGVIRLKKFTKDIITVE